MPFRFFSLLFDYFIIMKNMFTNKHYVLLHFNQNLVLKAYCVFKLPVHLDKLQYCLYKRRHTNKCTFLSGRPKIWYLFNSQFGGGCNTCSMSHLRISQLFHNKKFPPTKIWINLYIFLFFYHSDRFFIWIFLLCIIVNFKII